MRRARNIQELLDLLHIDVIGRKIEFKHEKFFKDYPLRSYVARDYEDFMNIVTHYYACHNAFLHKVDFFMPRDLAESHVRDILRNPPRDDMQIGRVQELLGFDSFASAVKNAQRGRHKGLIGVLESIKEAMKKKDVELYVRSVFTTNFSPSDFDKRVAFASEFIRKYGHLLLPGEPLINPYLLAAPGGLEGAIQNFTQLINEFRRTAQ